MISSLISLALERFNRELIVLILHDDPAMAGSVIIIGARTGRGGLKQHAAVLHHPITDKLSPAKRRINTRVPYGLVISTPERD